MARPGRGRVVLGVLCWAVAAAAAAPGPAPASEVAWPTGPSALLVDTPTAALPAHATIEARGRVFPGGGLEVRVDGGLWDRASLGAGFGGLMVIGDGRPDWDPGPGFALKLRAWDETWTLPALALGVDTRGAGFWDEGRDRYQFKSRGLYAVASKNYLLLGELAVSGGVSRSFESEDDGDPTVFVGIEKTLGARAGLALEYDLATNDDRDDGVFGRGSGYLNAALRIRPAPPLELRVVVRDMLKNAELDDPGLSDVIMDEGWGREVSLSWVTRPF
jgi:hypothetical protein